MTDRATPNLPSRDFTHTQAFYARLGFTTEYVDDAWLILVCEGITLEFFPHPELDPLTSWFSCCLRVDDADAWFERFINAGISQDTHTRPCIHMPQKQPSGLKMGALIDVDGTLLRVIEN